MVRAGVMRIKRSAMSKARTGAKVLEDDIYRPTVGQPADQVPPGFLSQVHCNTLTIATIRAPPQRCATAVQVPQVAKWVTFLRRLHLDDVGSKVAEQHPAKITRNDLPQIKDGESG